MALTGQMAVEWQNDIPRRRGRQVRFSGFDILMKFHGHPQVIEDIPNN